MEMMYALLLLCAVSSRVVRLRLQVPVHHFADMSVFALDFVAELHRLVAVVSPLGWKIPLEYRHACLRPRGQHDIQRDIVGITIEHPVGIDPEIRCAHLSTCLFVSTVNSGFVFWSADRTRLQ